MLLYNIGIYLYGFAVRLASLFNSKARLWIAGRRGLLSRLEQASDCRGKLVWMHCASLGEFEQGRPLLEAIRSRHPDYKIVLTFFSPSGYEIRKNYPGADRVEYLPLDTPRNARRFVGALQPDIAIFVKYEFWLNYLRQLPGCGCRTFIISAIFRRDSVFFRPYGNIFRKALGAFETIFVQDSNSAGLLAEIDIKNAVVAGDTRFDRVVEIAGQAKDIPLGAAFSSGHMTLVAGSTWPADEELLAQSLRTVDGLRMIIAPHETDSDHIGKIITTFGEFEPILYSQYKWPGKLPPGSRVLIIDTIGLLSSLYRYGHIAYIGGGFGAGIHNILEAAVYGLPVIFGPKYQKFREAREMIDLGAATSIANTDELSLSLETFVTDESVRKNIGELSAQYVRTNAGATEIIMGSIFREGHL